LSNEHFNLIAGFYNKVSSFNPSQALLDALDLPADGILLDAGGGTGRVAEAMSGYSRHTLVADVSLGMMSYAVQKKIPCIYTPVETLSLASDSIARIIMMDALHHVRDQTAAARELFRVLEPGGTCLIIEPDIRKVGVKVIALMEKLLLMRSRFLDGDEIAGLFSFAPAGVEVKYFDKNVWVMIKK
jgi:demethylmenaquinone methyltransferase/2-methoxy-6-polyprenyl-1,4-benzoquinol methylase